LVVAVVVDKMMEVVLVLVHIEKVHNRSLPQLIQ
jgi:hypothetical protein